MRVLPTLDVFGFGLGAPVLWPMGIGAGQPSALQRVGASVRFELKWDAAGRLAVVEIPLRPGLLSKRVSYRWADDGTLDRVEHDRQQADGSPGPDGTPEYESVWTWSKGLPIREETWAIGASKPDVTAAWDWSPDGRSVVVTESSIFGVLWVHQARFDDRGRLLCVDGDEGGDGTIDRKLELGWSPDGRILSARRRDGLDAPTVNEVTFDWDERGRLVGQTSDVYGNRDRWRYHYEGDDTP